jgi:hypothetical protein
MSRRTYIFVGPPGSAEILMNVIETALGRPFIHEPGSAPYVRADPIAVYVGGHDFDDGDIDFVTGSPVPLQTAYPYLVDIRDTERFVQRQQDTAERLLNAIKRDGRLKAVYIDDMQHVLDTYHPYTQPTD